VAIQYQTRANDIAAARPPVAALPGLRRSIVPRLSIPVFSTVVAVVMISTLLFVQTRQTTLGAAELLNRAEKWQENITSKSAPVLHRRFSLTKPGERAGIQRTYVDVWRRAGADVKWSRWSDSSGHILAEVRISTSALPTLAANTVWEFEPSADVFVALGGWMDRAKVSTAATEATIRTSSAELVLDRATNRPIAEKLSLDGNDYVFSEFSTETVPLAASPFSSLPTEPKQKQKHQRASIDPSPIVVPDAGLDRKLEERELRVRRELHLLGLAAAATIQRQGDTIDVQFAPTSTEQLHLVEAALEGIPEVQISLLDAQAAVRDAATIESSPGPLPRAGKLQEPLASKWLKASLSSDAEIHLEEVRRLEVARQLVDLAAEWRLLAERYPSATEAYLSADAKPILNEIIHDLYTQIRRGSESIAVAKLHAADPALGDASDPPCTTWQSQAFRAADLLWQNDQAVEQFYAPAPAEQALTSNTSLRELRRLNEALDDILRVQCNHQ
jgi:hypothetical protein